MELTPTELKILAQLMERPGRVMTKAQIYEGINQGFCESDEKTMMATFPNCGKKLRRIRKIPSIFTQSGG